MREPDHRPHYELRLKMAILRLHLRRTLRNARENWPYWLITIFVVLPLFYMATVLAVRTGMLSFQGGTPSSKNVTTFLTFIGGGLATAATMLGALLTAGHNRREQNRLRLQATLESVKLMTSDQEKAAAVLAAMVFLGQHRIALRVLESLESLGGGNGGIGAGTATWVIDQILTGGESLGGSDGHRLDREATREAATLLMVYAKSHHLTEHNQPGIYYFPGHFMRDWSIELDREVKEHILRAIMHILLCETDIEWWNPRSRLPRFPSYPLLSAACDPDVAVQQSAKKLLAILREKFEPLGEGDERAQECEDVVARWNHSPDESEIPRSIDELIESVRQKMRAA